MCGLNQCCMMLDCGLTIEQDTDRLNESGFVWRLIAGVKTRQHRDCKWDYNRHNGNHIHNLDFQAELKSRQEKLKLKGHIALVHFCSNHKRGPLVCKCTDWPNLEIHEG
jgi:hypothetical protein